ncbi:retrovirus-related pol polyprotein from transposon TNT 1-94, partial [Tanacetum coccineum]
NSQVNNCKIDLLTQEYENFSIYNEETIDSGFTRFNAIVTSLKSLDPDYSSKNHVYEMVLDDDRVASKTTKENVKYLAFKAKVTREQTSDDSDSQDESDEEVDEEEAEAYNLLARDFHKFFHKGNRFGRGNRFEGHFASEYRKSKENMAFVGSAWSDSEDADEQLNDATYNEELLKFNKDFTKSFEKKLKEKRAHENENSKLSSKINDLEIEVKKLANKALNFSEFKSSSIALDDMLSRQKLSQDKEGLGFSKNDKNTSVCLKCDLLPEDWIVHSGCTKHMTNNRRLFTSYKAYDGGHVVFRSNLRKILMDVSFTKVDCAISKNGKTLAKGHRRNSLYTCKLGDNSKQQICLASVVDNSTLWHRRLSHANMKLVQNLASKSEFDKLQFGSFCEQHRMSYNLSGPFTSQSNKIVERTLHNLRKMSRAMLDEQSIPKKFCCHALDTANYIFNRVYIRKFINKTPYEILRNRKPSLEYFRVFGCKVFIINTKVHLTKFDPKSYEGVFLGYSQSSKAYIMRNKETMRIEESLNVTFDESLLETKSSSSVEDDRINESIVQNLNGSLSLQVNVSDEGYPKGIKEARGHPIKQVIGELNERTLRFMLDDPNITMEEYIKLQAKKAQRRGRMFNWETTTYEKILRIRYTSYWFFNMAYQPKMIRYLVLIIHGYGVFISPLYVISNSLICCIEPLFEGLEYIDVDIADFKRRLGKIYNRGIHMVLVFDFEELTKGIAEGLSTRMLMEHTEAHGQSIFTTRLPFNFRLLYGNAHS